MKRNWGTQQLFCLSTQQQPLFPEEGLGEQSPFCRERNEVWDHLRNPNMHKSLGSNKVHPRFLRKLADALAKSLSMIFPKSWQSGEVPDVWKKGNIAPILRKGWKEEPGSHHPGSLTSVPGKFLEQMLLEAVLRTWRKGGGAGQPAQLQQWQQAEGVLLSLCPAQVWPHLHSSAQRRFVPAGVGRATETIRGLISFLGTSEEL